MTREEKYLLNLKKEVDEYYEEFFSRMSNSELLRSEKVLSNLIENDLVVNSFLVEEIRFLFDSIRDECVRRLSLTCKNEV